MDAPAKPKPQTGTKREQYNALLSQLKSDRTTWEPTWSDIGDFIAPYLHEFTATGSSDGSRRDSQIVNETPEQALGVAVSGLFNGLCDPTEVWLSLETSDQETNKTHTASVYLEETRDRLLAEISKSNFYTVVPEDFASILAFGTCASIALEDFGDSAFWFGAIPMGSYYVGNNARRRVNVVARELQMTARQMVEEFGLDNLSDAARSAFLNNRSETRFDVVHIVRPNPAFRNGALLSRDKKYVSCYYEPGQRNASDSVLLEEGFDTFPVQVARWSTRGNAPWGIGPGHQVLGSAKGLQAYEIDIALAREKQINPPMVVPPGTNLAALSLLPGALNQSSDPAGAQGLRPLYETKFDLADGKEGILELEGRVRDGFYNNIFLMIANDDGGKMTAREVMERAREKRLALTPILRLTHEYLTPRIARCLDIMGKRGLLPPIPPEMEGQTIRIQYKSVLAQAAMLESASAIGQHVLGFLAPLAQMDQEVLDNYDLDALTREHATKSGVPASGMRDAKEVEKLRAARAQMAQQRQQQEDAAMAAQTAQTLSKTDTGTKSALTDLAAAQGDQ